MQPSPFLFYYHGPSIFNQNKQTKELLDACNLEWSNKCIEFNKNIRPVKTASSLQVENLYTKILLIHGKIIKNI